jgi:mRNA interferase RelE/StbE
VTYEVRITPVALKMLQNISDRRVREKIIERIDSLKEDPEKQGKPLVGELAGYRSIRAVGQRYRIIYKVEQEQIIVFIVVIGIRKQEDKSDIYKLAQKLLRVGLIEPAKKSKK